MGELHVEIARLKDEPGNDLLAHGGATFAQALTRSGRRHVRASAHAVWPGRRIRLMIHPAALGTGLALFGDLPAPLHLDLVEAKTFATGAAVHVHRPRRPEAR